jgi:hypothetical protein
MARGRSTSRPHPRRQAPQRCLSLTSGSQVTDRTGEDPEAVMGNQVPKPIPRRGRQALPLVATNRATHLIPSPVPHPGRRTSPIVAISRATHLVSTPALYPGRQAPPLVAISRAIQLVLQ